MSRKKVLNGHGTAPATAMCAMRAGPVRSFPNPAAGGFTTPGIGAAWPEEGGH